jgi:hypothetical protein
LLFLPLALSRCSCPTRPIPDDGGVSSDASDGSPTDALPSGDGSRDRTGGCPATCPGPTSGADTGTGVCLDDACAVDCSTNYPTHCPSANTCVDLTSDGKNCGACGHDCLGGTCTAGQCQPIELAQYTGNLQTIAVGVQYVYATTDLGYIGQANKDGRDLKPFAMPNFASSTLVGTLVAEDGDRVFFAWYASTFQLVFCSISGCDVSITPVGGPYTQYFAVDQVDHKIFWVDYSPTALWAASTTGTVTGAPIPGGALPSGSNGSRLFYAQGGIFFADGSALRRISTSGGSVSTPTVASTNLTILGANDNNIYLFDGTSIVYTPLPNGTGGPPEKLIDASANPGNDGVFAADNSSVYWIDNGVQTCQIDNCAGTRRVLPSRSVDRAEDVGIDAQAIYWGADSPNTGGSGNSGCTVWKLAK